MLNDRSVLTEMYRRMLRIRAFEEAVMETYTRGLMRGLAHLSIGQEAAAVGACFALRKGDYVTSTHRGHGHLIAKGGRLDRMMAELMGKATGYNRGKGGTMHVADLSVGMLGANGIVGGSFGIATGAALSAKLRGVDAVVMCFFGDGAVNEGLFYESLNFASLWKLPIVFLCENNQYGEYTHFKKVTAGERIGLRASALGITEDRVDGQDVEKVYEVASVAIERARGGEGPFFIEAQTYRYRGHNVGDPGGYRTNEEIETWKARDPISLFEKRLVEVYSLTHDEVGTIRAEVSSEMEAALQFAKDSEFPQPSEVMDDVYA
jgi:acetoin:2,6-dichlorophenolindophenol oxidoreductase subunit alpha